MLLNRGVWEDFWESLELQGDQTNQSYRKSTLNIHWTDWCWSSDTLATGWQSWLIAKDADAGKDWRQEEKGITVDEMVGWLDRLNGHQFEQALEVGEGQGSLACCSPWGLKVLDTTEGLNNNIITFKYNFKNFFRKLYQILYSYSQSIHTNTLELFIF